MSNLKTKHTLGKWAVCYDKNNTHDWVFSQSTGTIVARFEHDEIDLEANAALIAAAPEMLEALEALVERVDCLNGDAKAACLKQIEDAYAAIKKAKGGA